MSVELDGANNTVKTDTISEITSANGITIDGLSIKDSKLVTANSVIEANMSANSVDSDSYVDGSIDNAHIADDAIDSEHYAAGSIDTAHIADGQITIGKLATAVLTGATDIGEAIVDADLLLVDNGAGGTLRKTTASRLKTYIPSGVTEADSWRLTTPFTDSAVITSNWERVDSKAFGHLGTGLSESSGIFTFPSTGFWLIRFVAGFTGSSLQSRHNIVHIITTADNSAYTEVTSGSTQMESDTSVNTQAFTEYLVDCISTTNVKVKFSTQVYNTSVATGGATGENVTFFHAVKLADT